MWVNAISESIHPVQPFVLPVTSPADAQVAVDPAVPALQLTLPPVLEGTQLSDVNVPPLQPGKLLGSERR